MATNQYISKSAVVADINRLQETTMDKNQNFLSSYHEGIFDGLSMIEKFLDTLEAKEVDLDLEISLWANAIPEIQLDDVERLAKHFFDLGFKAQKGE